MKRVIVINGPNINMLGIRDKKVYGNTSLEEINEKLDYISNSFDISIDFFQSNIEGEIVTKIQESKDYDGMIINAAAYSHYSVAILDALELLDIYKIEVHLSNIYSREEYRQKSIISKACDGVISGFKENSYILALMALKDLFREEEV